MDATVVEPFGLPIAERDRNLAYVEALTGQLLIELAVVLNEFHGTTHTLRYWKIVCGHWLQRYVTVVFNRYHTLEQALARSENLQTRIFDSSNYSLATKDSLSFIWACSDDVWNHVLCANILEFLGGVETEVDPIALRGVTGFVQDESSRSRRASGLVRKLQSMVNGLLPKLSRPGDAFIINSYLPFKEEVKLQLRLGQWPQLWRSPPLDNVAANPTVRADFGLAAGNTAGFERFVRVQLGLMIPICYVEGYAPLVRRTEDLPWPARPRHIFTANNFDTDEVFKAWAATKVEQGTPYFAGQHGNNYGTHVSHGNASWPERSATDQFLTWGDWGADLPQHSCAFIFKTAGCKPRQFDSSGGLLLIEDVLPHRLSVGDIHHQYLRYQESQFRFVKELPSSIHSRLTVRLHKAFRHGTWCDDQRWSDRSPKTQIEKGLLPIHRLIRQSRLVVHSYDSTGLLETLALDIPSLCFCHDGLSHVLPAMKPYYEALSAAGILVESPEEAAQFIASHWNCMDEWWASSKVQGARRIFCEQFTRTDPTPALTMSCLLRALETAHQSCRLFQAENLT